VVDPTRLAAATQAMHGFIKQFAETACMRAQRRSKGLTFGCCGPTRSVRRHRPVGASA